MPMRNVFACLVHEGPECVVDLVRNLHRTDPSSLVLLYNGGADGNLLNHQVRFEDYGAVVYPRPRRLQWGRLHEFALDCMRFALECYPFDTLTIVDSDQLAVRPGYSAYLESSLAHRQKVGLLGCATSPQRPGTRIGPAAAAFRELPLWRPLLRRFPDGESKFVYWTFWPSTVFTDAAARDLTQLFARDSQLQDIVARSRIWASEEVILPTLVALLGYEIAPNPCSYTWVKYRAPFTPRHVDVALTEPDAFWIHPVPRQFDNPLRRHIRARLNHYQTAPTMEAAMSVTDTRPHPGLALTVPILKKMREITGWLEEDEADLLIAASVRALTQRTPPGRVVEVGSYCGRSTVVLGSVVKALSPESRVYAIDPHDGTVGAEGANLVRGAPTRATFDRNIALAGVADVVVCIQNRSYEVSWDQPISLLLIDGLHDYANVARDFFHFERWVVDDGYVVFHDYAPYYPDVQSFVDELVASGRYSTVYLVGSLIVVRKVPAHLWRDKPAGDDGQSVNHPHTSNGHTPAVVIAGAAHRPTVSCIMPTCDRRMFIPRAIEYFLRQDYPERELIVVDDGKEPLADLIPHDSRIHYLRLEGKRTIGEKRNLACERARGEIIAHWDDDDWMADRRLSYQVTELMRTGVDLCGLATLLFYAPESNRAWRYIYPEGAKPWLSGGTLCYTRDVWKKGPFLHLNVGEDARFVWGAHVRHMLALRDETFYVALIHAGNTSPKRTNDVWWHAASPDEIRRLMGEDIGAYARLVGGPVSTSSHLTAIL